MSEKPALPPHLQDGKTLQDFMPGGTAGSGPDAVGRAGESLPADAEIATKEAVAEAIREVHDPEISVNIYDLGLIYDLVIRENGDVSIRMSLTSPMCPVAGILPQQVAEAAAGVEGVGRVEVHLVWDPPWTRDMMSDEAKLALDLY